MLKNFLNISKSIKLAIPHKLLKQIYIIYFCLIIAAVLEMIGLGSIPFFIGILLDSGTHFQIFGLNLTDAIKNIFNEKNFLIYFPLIIISIFLIKNIVMFIIIFLETSIVRNICLL